MGLIIAIAVVAILLGGFLILTGYEKKRGARVLAPIRARLDVRVGSATHVARKLNAGAFSTRLRIIGAYVVHEFVHAVLQGVRVVERFLTQTVRSLRSSAAPKGDTTGKVE